MSSGEQQQTEGGGAQPAQQEQGLEGRAAQDFAMMVSSLLQQMQGRFEQMSDTILGKIDEMDKRLDDLEGTMHTLASQSGVSLPPPPAAAASSNRALGSSEAAAQQPPHDRRS